MPSLLTDGISEDETQARAISSMTMQTATASAPAPPYASGTCTALQLRGHERLVDVPGELTGLVDLRRPRGDLVLDEGTHGRAEQLVLVGGAEQVGHAPIVGGGSRLPSVR